MKEFCVPACCFQPNYELCDDQKLIKKTSQRLRNILSKTKFASFQNWKKWLQQQKKLTVAFDEH
jgi:hypothetical protein